MLPTLLLFAQAILYILQVHFLYYCTLYSVHIFYIIVHIFPYFLAYCTVYDVFRQKNLKKRLTSYLRNRFSLEGFRKKECFTGGKEQGELSSQGLKDGSNRFLSTAAKD